MMKIVLFSALSCMLISQPRASGDPILWTLSDAFIGDNAGQITGSFEYDADTNVFSIHRRV
jgi:hypothetical protein